MLGLVQATGEKRRVPLPPLCVTSAFFLFIYTSLWLAGSRPQTVDKHEQAPRSLLLQAHRGLFFHMLLLGRKKVPFSFTLSGSVPGGLQIKLTEDRLTGRLLILYSWGERHRHEAKTAKEW